MSRLSVFWPDEALSDLATADEPMILQFPRRRFASEPSSVSPKAMDVVTRARVMYDNRKCRKCGYPVVEPVELSDSAVNLSGLAIPGTATLVGFHCRGCDAEWHV
jgi:hypothetical protein